MRATITPGLRKGSIMESFKNNLLIKQCTIRTLNIHMVVDSKFVGNVK